MEAEGGGEETVGWQDYKLGQVVEDRERAFSGRCLGGGGQERQRELVVMEAGEKGGKGERVSMYKLTATRLHVFCPHFVPQRWPFPLHLQCVC